MNRKTVGFVILNVNLFLFNVLGVLPVKAVKNDFPVFSVVNSENNPEQWQEISSRLQKLNVNYCIVPLSQVKDPNDWGKPRVLFLPNVELLTTEQAIALDQWVSQGGYLIASGPVGNLSTPGVRQLLRKLLGGYWGFSFNTMENLQPTNKTIPDWINQKELFGSVIGGVIIPNNSTTQSPVVWDSKERPPAILTTEKSTLFGWHWGKNQVASVELDIAWLKAALNRHLKLTNNSKNQVSYPAKNCQSIIITEPKNPKPQTLKKPTATSQSQPAKNPNKKTNITSQLQAKSRNSELLGSAKIINENLIDPINQLEQNVRLDVVPNSNQPIDKKEEIALQKELENLIGRLESTHVAALAYNSSKNINNSTTNSQVSR